MLFPVGAMGISETDGIFLVGGPQGRVKYVTKRWSDGRGAGEDADRLGAHAPLAVGGAG